ncbi:MAG TPA: AraC family transcriptional regulator, partial [Clostridia bacterium]|nr:AraC family transcriptional regulator [Clostridia bacterium]
PVEETELYALLDRIGDKIAVRQQQALLDDLDADGARLLRKAYPQGAWLWIQLGGPLLLSLPADQGARSGSARCVYVSRNLPNDWAALEAQLPAEVRGLGLAHWDANQPLDRALQHAQDAAYAFFFQPGTRVSRYRPVQINRMESFAALRRAAMAQSARDIHRECERLRASLPQMNLGLLNQLWMIAHAMDGEADLSPDALTKRFASAKEALDAVERALLTPVSQGPEADMEQVDAYLRAHHRENLSMDELAARFAMSGSALYQKFKQYAGCGIVKRVQDLRLRAACGLLEQTDLPVNDVAHAVGYEDALYFRKVFRKAFNTTPSAYRGAARKD